MMKYACRRERAVVLVGYRCGNRSGLGACGSSSSFAMMGGICTLGGSGLVTVGKFGGGAPVVTLVGSTVCVGTLGGAVIIVVVGGAVIQLNISASLAIAAVVSNELHLC
jgi:hypothetical protein